LIEITYVSVLRKAHVAGWRLIIVVCGSGTFTRRERLHSLITWVTTHGVHAELKLSIGGSGVVFVKKKRRHRKKTSKLLKGAARISESLLQSKSRWQMYK